MSGVIPKKIDQEEINARRAEYADVGIQVAELEKQLAEIRADYKGRIKPLLERMSGILDEIKSGGEWVTTEVFLFKDMESGMAAIYTPDGHLLEKRPLTPGEKQPTIMTALRSFRTGTDDYKPLKTFKDGRSERKGSCQYRQL